MSFIVLYQTQQAFYLVNPPSHKFLQDVVQTHSLILIISIIIYLLENCINVACYKWEYQLYDLFGQ